MILCIEIIDFKICMLISDNFSVMNFGCILKGSLEEIGGTSWRNPFSTLKIL